MNCCDDDTTPSKVPTNLFAIITSEAVNEPVTKTDPVNICVSSKVLPNTVEPLLYDCVTFITDDDTTN